MKKATFLLTTVAAAFFAASTGAYASDMGGYNTPPPSGQTKDFQSKTNTPKPTDIRPELAAALRDAADTAKKNDYAGALAKVRAADTAVTDKAAYEEYVVANFMTNFAIKANDHATATIAVNRALASDAVPEKELPAMLQTGVTLNAEAKNYDKAIAYGDQLKKLGQRDAATETNVAIAYYNSGKFQDALQSGKGALDLEKQSGKPLEQTLIIIKNSQIKLNDTKGALQTEVELCNMSATEPKAQCDAARKATGKS